MQNPARFGTEFGKIRGTGGLVLCVKGSAGIQWGSEFTKLQGDQCMAKPKSIDEALAHVDESRRGFLKGLLLGSAALAALPLMNSNALAQDQGGAPPDDGKGKGKKGKGKKGKGDGGDDSGKGKGDN
jgi:hypothetical protein